MSSLMACLFCVSAFSLIHNIYHTCVYITSTSNFNFTEIISFLLPSLMASHLDLTGSSKVTKSLAADTDDLASINGCSSTGKDFFGVSMWWSEKMFPTCWRSIPRILTKTVFQVKTGIIFVGVVRGCLWRYAPSRVLLFFVSWFFWEGNLRNHHFNSSLKKD